MISTKNLLINDGLGSRYDIDAIDIDVALAEARLLPLTTANIDQAIKHIEAIFKEQK